MPYQQLPINYPGDMPSASALNVLQGIARAAGRITGDSNTGVRQGADGLAVFDSNYLPFYGKILSGTKPYAWIQLTESDGTFVNDTEARSGTTTDWPAYPLNGSTTVPANTPAKFYKAADGDYYWFVADLGTGGGGSGFTGNKNRVTAVSCLAGALSVTVVIDTYVNGALQ